MDGFPVCRLAGRVAVVRNAAAGTRVGLARSEAVCALSFYIDGYGDEEGRREDLDDLAGGDEGGCSESAAFCRVRMNLHVGPRCHEMEDVVDVGK